MSDACFRRDGPRWSFDSDGCEVRVRIHDDGVAVTHRAHAPADAAGAAALTALARELRAGACRSVVSREAPERDPWHRALQFAGFGLHRRKLLVRRDLTCEVPTGGQGLSWRTLDDVGDAHFLSVLDACSEGDPFEDEDDRDPEREWRELLAHAGEHLDRTLWRTLVVDGTAAGVVLPTVFPGDPPEGTLSYVGVLPAFRGRGLGRALHAAGLRRLTAAGAMRYVGSTDARNEAMARVFEQNGCETVAVQLFFR